MKRLILITAALSALVAASAAVAHLKTGDVTQVSATLSAATAANVQTRTRHLRRPDDRDHARPLLRHGDEHDDRAERPGRPVREEHVQHDEEARLGRRLGQGPRDRQAHAGELHGDQRRRKARRLAPRLCESPRRRAVRQPGGLLLEDRRPDRRHARDRHRHERRCDREARSTAGDKPTRPSVFLFVRGEVDSVSATAITVKPKDGSANQTCTVKNADQVKGIAAKTRSR